MVRLHNLNEDVFVETDLFGYKGILSQLAEGFVNETDFGQIDEMTISGHRPLIDALNEKLNWTKTDTSKNYSKVASKPHFLFSVNETNILLDFRSIKLQPLDSRAFRLNYSKPYTRSSL